MCECSIKGGWCSKYYRVMTPRLVYLCKHSNEHRKLFERQSEAVRQTLNRSFPSLTRRSFTMSRSLILWLVSGFRIAKHEFRLAFCNSCEGRKGSRCRPCGCFLWLKTRMPHEACPAGLWGPEPAPKESPCGKITADEPQVVQIGGLIHRKGGCGCAKS